MNSYQAVIDKYGEQAIVWLVTLHDGTGWEQTIYVITPNKEFAQSVARARTVFDKPRLGDSLSRKLRELEDTEIELFIGPGGQPQNIIVFDAEPGE